ncbi:MAG TPA: hypothetical protein VEU77_09505 [Candidatus Acidoferrales bacterium]|nr:hypothetical protein [Candidatus Acidoferrales bacterium]
MEERPIEALTDHRCVLGLLTRQLASAGATDRAVLAADALARLLDSGGFDACCLPRYLTLAPERFAREIQIPIAVEGDVETRVIVWPIGARDGKHPHTDGWTVFVPVTGALVTLEQVGDDESVADLVPRVPVVLRPDEHLRHLVRNIGDGRALSVHISGSV